MEEQSVKNKKNPHANQTLSREENLRALTRRLGCRFKDLSLLDRALRHSSYTYEHSEAGPSNEQMEFLGDAVLALTISTLLIDIFPEASEGELSRRRAALVNARQLAEVARGLNLSECLLVGRGEARQAGHEMIGRWFAPILARQGPLTWQDPKTALQELTQARCKQSPSYHLLEETGPSHARRFRVELRLGNKPLAQGEGSSKKQAEQQAASAALKKLQEKKGGGGGLAQ